MGIPHSVDRSAWRALERHQRRRGGWDLRDLFQGDATRGERFSLEDPDLLMDYSKQLVTDRTMTLLFDLARSAGLAEAIEAMFAGRPINKTEGRAVLHTALRRPAGESVVVDGRDIIEDIQSERRRMAQAAEAIRRGAWRGFSGEPIRALVHIGIGGSSLGPIMAHAALGNMQTPELTIRFVSNLDGADLRAALEGLLPRNTLFIVATKSFTTQETMTNALSARRWFLDHSGADDSALGDHFLAITANTAGARSFGISEEHIFPMWDWIGGRFSLASAIGFSLLTAIGTGNFQEFLDGLYSMDTHFRERPFEQNMPVILGLLGIWNSNFHRFASHAVLPYSHRLRFLPRYLQQLEMESNGKRVNRAGEVVDYGTAQVVWGAEGTNGQHAFHQLLHQGTQVVPADFIGFCESGESPGDHQQKLMANMLAQSRALAFGKNENELRAEGTDDGLAAHKACPGNRPSTTLLARQLTPFVLGKLIALYEHKVFTQGLLWDIYSFDQWGVELGKQLAGTILPLLESRPPGLQEMDSSTRNLIRFYQGRDSRQ